MDAFGIGNKILTVDSLKLKPKNQAWKRASDHTELRVQILDDDYLKTITVNPQIYRETGKNNHVRDAWTVVYLLALYNGDAIKSDGSLTSLWYSVNNNTLFAICSTHLRTKALTWFDYLRGRSVIHKAACC